MILSRTKLFVVIVTIAGVFSFAPQIAQAGNTPQICNDGYAFLGTKQYERAIRALTRCLNKRPLTSEVRAIAYYDRGAAYYLMGLLNQDHTQWEEADTNFEKALSNVEKSIKAAPANAASAYCLRGRIWLEISFGEVGYADLKKGKAMGAPDDRCQP